LLIPPLFLYIIKTMQMEELNKTQIILLTLLVSFVTSIATGIVTVTLMDQAPPGITQTINRIVERTVEVIVPEKSQEAAVTNTVVVKEEDFVIKAAEKIIPNIVRVGFVDDEEISWVATGSVISPDGIIVVDSTLVPDGGNIILSFSDGTKLGAQVVDTTHRYLTLLAPVLSEDDADSTTFFDPVVFQGTDLIKIGQTAIALGMGQSVTLALGTVSSLERVSLEVPEVDGEDSTSEESLVLVAIYTTVDTDQRYSGGPLVTTDGEVSGIFVVTPSGEHFVVPSNIVMLILERYKESLEAEVNID